MRSLVIIFLLFSVSNTNAQFCWQPQTSGTSNGIRAMHFAPTGHSKGIYGTSYGEIGRTNDAGDTWNITASLPVINGDFSTTLIQSVYIDDAQNCFAATFAGQMYKSIDGGTSWVLKYQTEQINSYFYKIRKSNGKLFVSSFQKLFFSYDYGESWDSLSTFSGSITDLSFDGNNGVLIDYPNKLFVTSDLGDSWTELTNLPHSQSIFTVHMIDSATFITAGAAGEIYGTTDGGNSWTSIASGTTEDLENVQFGNENIGLISGLNGTLLSTSDGIFGPWSPSANSASNTTTIYGLHAHTGTYAWFGNENGEVHKAPCLPVIVEISELIVSDTLCFLEAYDYTIKYDVIQGVAENLAFKVLLNGENITNGFTEQTGVFNLGSHSFTLSSTVNLISEQSYGYSITVVPDLNSTASILDIYDPVKNVFVSKCAPIADTLNTTLSSYAFSPNNDGVNDVLVLDFLEGVSNTVQIYNRWGDLLAEFSDYNNTTTAWGGIFNGRTVDPGTYFFTVAYNAGNQHKGWIQVVR